MSYVICFQGNFDLRWPEPIYLPFLALKVPVLRRNKATNSSISTNPFSAATKTFVLGNLFKFERFAITFARGHLAFNYNEKNKTIVIFSSSLSPSSKFPVRM